MTKKMLIDAGHPEEVRVVVTENGRVEDFDFESASRKPLRGNIYLARVTRVEPSLQAAFIEYGGNRHGFLAFSEIHPDYYQIPVADRRLIQEADEEIAKLAAELELVQRGDDVDDEDEDDETGAGGADVTPDEGDDADVIETADIDASDDSNVESGGDETAEADSAKEVTTDSSPEASDENQDAVSESTPSEEPSVEEEEEEEEVGDNDSDAANDDHQADAGDDDAPVEEADAPEAAAEASSDEDGAENNDTDVEEESGDNLEAEAPDEDGGAEYAPAEDDPAALLRKERQALYDQYKDAQRKRARLLRNYKIQEVVKRRQILLVQVVKEERGNKGAALTTYMSLAGRYCVLMPNTARGGGISRKIPSASDRKRLRRVVDSLDVGTGMGLIIRTAGAKRTKVEIKRDFDYLTRLWENIRDLTLKSVAPCLIYEEANLIKRAIRDLYDKDIGKVIVEGEDGYREAKDFMKMLMPSHAKNVQRYKERTPLFLKYDIEQQLDDIYQPTVRLKSGGYLVINQTEALIAIDVNSGKSTRERNIETTAVKTNIEAAKEAARQFRLRDLAGLLVLDFIDMEEPRNNRAVEKKLKEALKHDRARIQVGRISNFGLLEMSRQRRRSGIVDGTTNDCPTCAGAGVVRSMETAALRILRLVEGEALKGKAGILTVKTSTDCALYILNHKRSWLRRIENAYGVSIEMVADPQKAGDLFDIEKRGVPREVEDTRTIVRADQPEIHEEPGDVQTDATEADDETTSSATTGEEGATKRKRRPRKRRRRPSRDGQSEAASSDEQPSIDGDAETPTEGSEPPEAKTSEQSDGEEKPKKRRRRGRRGGRRNRPNNGENATPETPASEGAVESAAEPAPIPAPEPAASPVATVQPAPEPAKSEPAVVEAAETPKAKKPARKGWWSRAIGG